ncbi:MAG: N-acetylmuramoyl-L-alanine amidase [Paludibacter sp.]|nr:N-acetylmuramoyl-L-alanine amidase [Paludibacter sp.]
MKPKNIILTFCLILFLSIFCQSDNLQAQNYNFVLVIDAGHGGHDAGAVGAIAREKDINLAVTLKLGTLIEQNFKDVKVVYTRKTDIFLPLQDRADIVNNNKADLFICIHTNATKGSTAYGAETYTLGLAKSKQNLEVAMMENSVILLEDDYKTKYKGFDPSSVDSYIMFEFMQDKYIDKSIEIASAIQNQFVSYSRRHDRGVRQAGFWVLHRSACPSVLVELGFISNPLEERFLASESGKNDMSASIYNAFVKYKKNHDKKLGIAIDKNQKYELIEKRTELANTENNSREKTENNQLNKNIITDTTKESVNSKNANQISDTVKSGKTASIINKPERPKDKMRASSVSNQPVYKIQLFAIPRKLNSNAPEFKGLKDVNFYFENGFYKYTVGEDKDYNTIVNLRKEILKKFPEAYIIAFVGDKKMTAKEALIYKK